MGRRAGVPSIPSSRPAFLFSLLISFFIPAVWGTLTNRTIDDTNGDSATGAHPTYSPSGSTWFTAASCATSGCTGVPTTAGSFDGTWTAALYLSSLNSISATMQFSGTAIYIYFIVPNFASGSGEATLSTANFLIDGGAVGSYQHETDGSGNWDYGVLVYANSSVPNGQHTFEIQTTGSNPAIIVFDRAVYTFDDNENPAGAQAAVTTTSSQAASPATTSDTTVPTTTSSSSLLPTSSSIIPFPSNTTLSPTNTASISIAPFDLTAADTATPTIPAIAGATSPTSHESSLSTTRIVAISAGGGGTLIVLVLVAVVTLLCVRRKRQRRRAMLVNAATISSFDLLPKPKPNNRPSRWFGRAGRSSNRNLEPQMEERDQEDTPTWVPPHELVARANANGLNAKSLRGPLMMAASVPPSPASSVLSPPVSAAGPSGYGRVVGGTQVKPFGTETDASELESLSEFDAPSPSFIAMSAGHRHALSSASTTTSSTRAQTIPASGPSNYGRVVGGTQNKPESGSIISSANVSTVGASAGHSAHTPSGSYSSSIAQSQVSASDPGLRINIPAHHAPSPLSAAPATATTPLTRNGAPLPPDEEAAVRTLLSNHNARAAQPADLRINPALLATATARRTSFGSLVPYTPSVASGRGEEQLVLATPTTANPYRYTYRRPPNTPLQNAYDGMEVYHDDDASGAAEAEEQYFAMLRQQQQQQRQPLGPRQPQYQRPGGVQHVDSGIRIRRTMLELDGVEEDLPPGYSAA
ncbi:hypothetical protein HMN09_00319300 [Mycena chlorophos]|uniref:Uncharacterized protein n=1 Tax=Mycena chlorophos TaxID=658473 RepID=A0A8H6WMT6_MYCCL|nr:hypothetical protein HMN09_00319300 [Mycena chlorophos]